MKSPTATDDTYWFLVTCDNADMTFGIPAAIARGMDSIHSIMAAEKHLQPQCQQPFGFVIAKLCLTSREAKEDPAARGIQMETTTNPVPSWFGGGVTITFVNPTKTDAGP